MPATLTPNEKPAAATIRDGLNLVSTTTPRPQQKDATNVHYHIPCAPFKAI